MNGATQPEFDIDAFERGDIDPGSFDHAAHVYLAWCYLERFPLPDALQKFDAALQRLTAQLGVPGKYHATITWFFLLLIAERRSAECTSEPGAAWVQFCQRNPDLFDSQGLLQRYYRRQTLASGRARRSFVLPDRGLNPVRYGQSPSAGSTVVPNRQTR